jgi:tetratricopeptide (TPR) repeat protein
MRVGPARIAIASGLAMSISLFAAIALGGSQETRPGWHLASAIESDAVLGPGSAIDSLDATIASLQARMVEAPDDWRAAASLGSAYVQRARITADPASYPPAQGVLLRSLRAGPNRNPDAFVGMGSLAAARHDFAAALDWGRRAVRAAPYDADAYGLLGDAQLELGRYGAAFRSFQTMMDTRPDLAAYARVSYALELRGDVAGSIRAMRAAYDLAGGRADAAWAGAQIGKLLYGAGRVGEAEAWFRRARAADPASLEAQTGLAQVAWAEGRLERAIADYESLVARYPAPELVATLGDLYAAAGDPQAASGQYELVRTEGRLFRANGVNTDLEIALFDADHPDGGSARAALRAARAEWARRHSIHVADAMAWALYANGRYREASVFSERALRLGTRNALFLFHAGMIRLRLGDEDGARALLQEAVGVNPHFSVRWAPVLRSTLAGVRA